MAKQSSKAINLGVTPPKPSKADVAQPAKKTGPYYPSVYINDIPDLHKLPDGEFTFTGTGKLISRKVEDRNGKKTCSCELEIHSIEPDESTEAGDTLDDALDKIEAKKSGKSTKQIEADEGESPE